jgi:uncharacterized protein YbbK (DUF523 family)/RimJ/RimL family protein N-acetyltransferase
MHPVLMSACLLGAPCRYDGRVCSCSAAIDLAATCQTVPVCPEQLGGLPTPRTASELDMTKRYPRVLGIGGEDRTEEFLRGAEEAAAQAVKAGCTVAVLKSKSPSCGAHAVYDGTFRGVLVPGAGVMAARLRQLGIRVIDEAQLQAGTHALFADSSAETPVLETERLIVRPLTDADADGVWAYAHDPEVGPGAGWAPHRRLDDSLFFIREIASAPHVFGLFEKETGAVVGSAGLIGDTLRAKNTDCRMLGYALARDRWGRGYMAEACRELVRYGFDDLQLSLITCNCYTFNDRSRRVIENLGFTYEGTLRSVEPTPDGRMQDVRSYSLLQSEYQVKPITPAEG